MDYYVGILASYFSMTAMTSSSRMTSSSSPSTFTSVPQYLPNRILSPTLDVERADFAVLEDLALADRDDLPLDRLFGRRVRNHDAARGFALFFETPDHDHAVMQGTKLHGGTPFSSS